MFLFYSSCASWTFNFPFLSSILFFVSLSPSSFLFLFSVLPLPFLFLLTVLAFIFGRQLFIFSIFSPFPFRANRSVPSVVSCHFSSLFSLPSPTYLRLSSLLSLPSPTYLWLSSSLAPFYSLIIPSPYLVTTIPLPVFLLSTPVMSRPINLGLKTANFTLKKKNDTHWCIFKSETYG